MLSQFKVLINILNHGHIIVMNDEVFFDIAQDVGVVSITVNVKSGLDPHFRLVWAQFVPHVSHTVSQVLV